jgi:choline dehydrogenase-like flavoprotein
VLAQASHGTHQISTARMATSRQDGVVDRDLRVFDADNNLYIASSAVLPK